MFDFSNVDETKSINQGDLVDEKYNAKAVSDIAAKILEHKKNYYSGQPTISDADYDALEESLRKLAPDHPVLSVVGAAPEPTTTTEEVGTKAVHAVPMLSLAKTYSVEDLTSWVAEREVVATYKIDGNSLSLVYVNGALRIAKTRGNGRVGENVSSKISWVPDCVPKLSVAGNYEIRGELYCSDSSFILLANEMEKRGLEKPTNPRNIVAGVLGRKTHLDLARYFSFFAFDILSDDGGEVFKTETAKFDWLDVEGFKLPPYKFLGSSKELMSYLDQARIYMDQGDVGIDGVVFTYNDTSLHEALGATAHHPRYKMSFKWAGETAQAVIKEIVWATSRLGIVTPVAVIEPVYLSGANISNITLHNAAHVKAYNLKPHDKIEIIRSGEVIPKFLRVIDSAPGNTLLPKVCPSCGTILVEDDVRLTCPNSLNCPSQRLGSIINWIKAASIDDLSEKRMSSLIELGLVKTPGDLYRLSLQDFLKLPLTKEKMASKLFKNIQATKSLPISSFLTGLGISGTGRNTWELLLEKYPSLNAIRAVESADIVKIKGFADKLGEQIVRGLKEKSDQIHDLLEVGVSPIDYVPAKASGVLDGLSFVITGTLSKPRAQIQKDIKAQGGTVLGAVTKNTSVLIVNDKESNSSKLIKAKELGTELWSEDELYQKI